MSIKSDEEVVFFPTYGRPDGAGGWTVDVRGWIFEPEEDSAARRLLIGMVSQALGLEPAQVQTEIFHKRAWAFLVDNERGKRLAVRCGGAVHDLEPSGADGHFGGQLRLAAGAAGWVDFEAVTAAGDDRRFAGRAHLMSDSGLSIVSDIDD